MYDNASRGHNNLVDKDADDSTAHATQVGDPIKVSTKGAHKDNIKDGNVPVTKNGRPLAHDERKKKRVLAGAARARRQDTTKTAVNAKKILSKCFALCHD